MATTLNQKRTSKKRRVYISDIKLIYLLVQSMILMRV